MRIVTALTVVAALCVCGACKPRNPDEGGLLSDDNDPAAAAAAMPPGGDWTVVCRPAASDPSAESNVTYEFAVSGAVSETDDGQDVVVSVTRQRDGAGRETLVDRNQGHGALAPQGDVFLGFTSGLLTAASIPRAGNITHTGVLTLSDDAAADGLKVSCGVSKTNATASPG